MALDPNRNAREMDKFVECGTKTAVRTKICQETGERLDVDAEIQITGFQLALKTHVLSIGDTATLIPATALTDRNSLSLVNLDAAETLYIGNSNVEANRTVGGNGGWEVAANESFNIDIGDGVSLYGIAESGKTILIKVLETS